MSGRKRATVSLSETDRKRLQEAQQRFMRMESDFQAIRARFEQTNHPALIHSLQEIEDRQAHFSDTMNGISTHLAEIEQRTSDQLVAHTMMLIDQQEQAVRQTGAEVYDHTASLVDDYAYRMMTVIEENNYSQQAEFERIHSQLKQQRSNANRRSRIVQSVLESAYGLFTTLRTVYASEPSRLEYFQDAGQALSTAWNNLQSGFLDAALVVGQEQYQSLSKARVEIERMIQTRTLSFNRAWTNLQTLAAAIEEAHAIHAMDMDGNILEIQLNPEEWCPGQLSALADYVQEKNGLLEQPIENLRIEELDELAADLESLMSAVTQIVQDTRLSAISSQVRFNIAEIVLGALSEQGFYLVDSNYAQDDMRESYLMNLEDGGGSELEIQIMPIPGEVIAHDLEMVTLHPEKHTEHEMRQRGKELAGSLRNFGLQLGRNDGSGPVRENLTSSEPVQPHSTPVKDEKRTQQKRS